jgi:hypothetical protein
MTSNSVLDRRVDGPIVANDVEGEAPTERVSPQGESPVQPTSAGPGVSAPSAPPAFSAKDAAELAARREAEARLEAKLRGWKPLTIWYAAWAILIAIGSFSALGSGQAGAGLFGLALCAAAIKYAHYLYNGGRRRVWFFIW